MNEDRRAAIIWLLEHRNDHLPSMRSASPVAQAGFVAGTDDKGHPLRSVTCPDCLERRIERGRVPCETCGGSGELPDDGPDPYAKNEKILPFGFDRTRHDATADRDRQIARLDHQTRPARPESELLEEANRRGYAWEEERRAMYRQHDFAPLDRALDWLIDHDIDASHALNAVYVDGWLAEVGQITPLIEVHCDRGLTTLSVRLPDPLRTGLTKHPALLRRDRANQQEQAA